MTTRDDTTRIRAGLGWQGLAGTFTLLAGIAIAACTCYLAAGRPRLLPQRQMN